MTKIAIMGFVGCGNVGDEAILAGTLRALKQAGEQNLVVFSWKPEETALLHGVTALPVLPGLKGLWDFRSHLHRGDLFMLGGGSLLQDRQRRIVPFWLARGLVARLVGCTVVFHAQGVGPIKTILGNLLMRIIAPFVPNLVTLRDAESFRLISSSNRPHLVADPALLLPSIETERVPGRIVVAARKVQGLEDREKDLVACLTHFAKRNNLKLLFVPMHYPDDCEMSERLASLSGGVAIVERLSVAGMQEIMASAEMVVAMRLHAAVLAAGTLTPIVGLSYDPKVSSFFAQVGLADALCPWDETFRYQKFLDILDHSP